MQVFRPTKDLSTIKTLYSSSQTLDFAFSDRVKFSNHPPECMPVGIGPIFSAVAKIDVEKRNDL